MKILGLEKFEITKSDLSGKFTDTIFRFSIHLEYYPNIEELKQFTPKERRLKICRHLRNGLKRVKTVYPTEEYKLIGTSVKPRGIDGKLRGGQLSELLQHESADTVFVDNVDGINQIKPLKKELYFSVQALFAAKIEGYDYSNSVRHTEERIILVKAVDSKNAEEKAMLEFQEYTKAENINGDYRFASWEFIEIMDVYETDVEEIDPNGTEVFSIWKNRKVKKG